MAQNVVQGDDELLRSIKTLLWGNIIKEDVFSRWAQGFYFSPDEPTALVQTEGGPCAVIAPVQAFIFKHLLSECNIDSWKSIKPEKCYQFLVRACIDILKQAAGERDPKFTIVHRDYKFLRKESQEETQKEQQNDAAGTGEKMEEEERVVNDEASKVLPKEKQGHCDTLLEQRLVSDKFHFQLRVSRMNTPEEAEKFLTDILEMLKDQYGVLLLLYSVIATKGVSAIHSEMLDSSEPMIDSTYGYGSQSLINLMLTGRAVSHVWDHDQNIGGLKLRGIDKQNSVGFLALLEHLRYCEVGTFLKSPSNPVWVLGSETHLSVLFSTAKELVSPDTPSEQAKRVFRRFDPEGYNFIASYLLQDLLAELGLVADAEYVDIMRKKLDSENLGIILRTAFMDEFFPEELWNCPDTFPLYHYNGLQRSNPDNRVKYHKGHAVLLECAMKGVLESNPMQTVLQTKWPRIEIQWDIGQNPSLN